MQFVIYTFLHFNIIEEHSISASFFKICSICDFSDLSRRIWIKFQLKKDGPV